MYLSWKQRKKAAGCSSSKYKSQSTLIVMRKRRKAHHTAHTLTQPIHTKVAAGAAAMERPMERAMVKATGIKMIVKTKRRTSQSLLLWRSQISDHSTWLISKPKASPVCSTHATMRVSVA